MVIERMICLSNGSTAHPVVMRQNDYNTAEIRLLVYETPDQLLDMTGMAAVVIYEVAGVPTDPYEATVEESHCLRFVVPGEVTETHGNGRMQIGIYLENSLTHSYMLPYEVEYSLPMPGPGTQADPAPAFFSLVKEAREAMANVKNGGYYSPNVDETGTLSWVGSDSDMPVLPTVNIMGPKGNDGQKGDAGSTPIINENGNWELDGADTGVKADWSEEQTNAATSAAAAAASATAATGSAANAEKSAEEAAASLGELNAKKAAAIDAIQAAGDSTLASIPQDYTSLANDVAGMANAIVIDDLDPANLVHVTDAAARPAVELISFIEPYQEGSGDPSLDNVGGWSAVAAYGTGKNMISKGAFEQGGLNGNTGAELAGTTRLRSPFIPVSPTSYYTLNLSKNDVVKGYRVFFYDRTKTFISFTSITSNPYAFDCSAILKSPFYIRILLQRVDGADIDGSMLPDWLQLEAGKTATAHDPYQPIQTLTADLPETVYGGRMNWTAGVLVSTLDADGNNLAEPKTIQLTSQQLNMLKGVNNVWSNCGETKLVYVADTKKYIDGKFAALAAAQLGV